VVSAPTGELHNLPHARQVDRALFSIPDASAQGSCHTEAMVWVGSKPTLELHEFGGTMAASLRRSCLPKRSSSILPSGNPSR
jgi:hypothetical protein